jgi:predicted nucleic acid-binding protein
VTVVADTGALYALIDASDSWHERVVTWWKTNTAPIVIPVTVIPELTWLLQTRIGPLAEAAFVRAVVDGEFVIEPLDAADIAGASEILERYADLPLGFVDATIVAVAERLETRAILTTDRRHFGVVQPRKGRFVLVP